MGGGDGVMGGEVGVGGVGGALGAPTQEEHVYSKQIHSIRTVSISHTPSIISICRSMSSFRTLPSFPVPATSLRLIPRSIAILRTAGVVRTLSEDEGTTSPWACRSVVCGSV